MELRVAIRNWLLKPGKAELAGDPKAVTLASELVFGHVLRDMQREVAEGGPGVREIPSMTEQESAFVNGDDIAGGGSK